ncbi:MAG: tetratricopeptide repeat protein [Oligoflexus sp.]
MFGKKFLMGGSAMDGLHKLIVIYNGSQPIRILDFLVSLQSSFSIEILTLASEQAFSSYRLGIPVKIFENVQHMPGYLRGLEPYIKNADAVLAFGSYEMTSYQAAKTCEKYAVPLFLVTNPDEPYCSRISQEKLVIHNQLMGMVKHLFVFSQRAIEVLNIEGLDHEKATRLCPFSSLNHSGFEPTRRLKFREYIGVKQEQVLFLLQKLNDYEQLKNILFAARLLVDSDKVLAEKFRLLLVNCIVESDYRYLICELGLSKNILILNQDVSVFEFDLYSASDVAIECALRGTDDTCDFWILEAMKSGMTTMSIGSSAVSEYRDELDVIFVEQAANFQALSYEFSKLLSKVEGPRSREEKKIHVSNNFKATSVGEKMAFVMTQMLCESKGHTYIEKSNFANLSSNVKTLIERAEWGPAEKLLEEWKEVDDLSADQKATFQCLKADLLFSQSKFDDAMRLYEKALKYDTNHWQALLGLAKVSVVSHMDEDALIFFKRAMAFKPNLAEAYEGIGFIHRRNSMHEEAIYWLSQAVLLQPENSKSLLQLTQACLEVEEDLEPAIVALEKVMTMVGEHTGLIMALGQLYMKTGKLEQGREMVDRALELSAALSESA